MDELVSEGAGLPVGTLIELAGGTGSGKTYLSYEIMAAAQKQGYASCYFNVENGFYAPRAMQVGLNVEDDDTFFLIENLGAAEKYADILRELIKTGEFKIFVLDSITAMIPEADYEKPFGDPAKIGAHAQFVQRLCKDVVPLLAEHNCILLVINQFRFGQGVMPQSFQKKPTGGEGLGFYSHVRLWLNAITSKTKGKHILNDDGEIIGGRSMMTVAKSRYTKKQHAESVMDIMFTEADADPTKEFLYRCEKIPDVSAICKVSRKVHKYFDPDDGDEKIATKDVLEFFDNLQKLPAPENKPKKDQSTNAFEFLSNRIKFTERDQIRLKEYIEKQRNTPKEEESAQDKGDES